MESIVKVRTSHDGMMSVVISGSVDHKCLSIDGFAVNEESKEIELQKITSAIILQDFRDVEGANPVKFKKAVFKEFANSSQCVLIDVGVKTLSTSEMIQTRSSQTAG
eukprot:717773-Amphidinium_carterae.2